eukprot:CAMPEP_0177234098 /NCGR_PEP_ID=MMETSP0367-20130122/44216_1 /TAXON_ID=447022 ORGANISM="Scrippsiella hangoei-like, Strain SHHI-4" /NCGR_SAMPLE_ID=MMETSP0367 /ASSEMBLY_ACC=CAM_ASM_000362 /LENGTH=310 /DNA_ID=CAMNT_0018684871 /DNA_START=1 /DNA_END=929 /DNA_ORIENTATION=+
MPARNAGNRWGVGGCSGGWQQSAGPTVNPLAASTTWEELQHLPRAALCGRLRQLAAVERGTATPDGEGLKLCDLVDTGFLRNLLASLCAPAAESSRRQCLELLRVRGPGLKRQILENALIVVFEFVEEGQTQSWKREQLVDVLILGRVVRAARGAAEAERQAALDLLDSFAPGGAALLWALGYAGVHGAAVSDIGRGEALSLLRQQLAEEALAIGAPQVCEDLSEWLAESPAGQGGTPTSVIGKDETRHIVLNLDEDDADSWPRSGVRPPEARGSGRIQAGASRRGPSNAARDRKFEALDTDLSKCLDGQ